MKASALADLGSAPGSGCKPYKALFHVEIEKVGVESISLRIWLGGYRRTVVRKLGRASQTMAVLPQSLRQQILQLYSTCDSAASPRKY